MPKIYKAGIQSVSETPFNCEADGLFQFLKEVKDRADKMGWTEGILSITKNIGETSEAEEDFLSNCGTLHLSRRLRRFGQTRLLRSNPTYKK